MGKIQLTARMVREMTAKLDAVGVEDDRPVDIEVTGPGNRITPRLALWFGVLVGAIAQAALTHLLGG